MPRSLEHQVVLLRMDSIFPYLPCQTEILFTDRHFSPFLKTASLYSFSIAHRLVNVFQFH